MASKKADPLLASPETVLFRKGAELCYLWSLEEVEGSPVVDRCARFYRVTRFNRSDDKMMMNVYRRLPDGSEVLEERGKGSNYKVSSFLRLYFAGKLAICPQKKPKGKIKYEIICRNGKGAYICINETNNHK